MIMRSEGGSVSEWRYPAHSFFGESRECFSRRHAVCTRVEHEFQSLVHPAVVSIFLEARDVARIPFESVHRGMQMMKQPKCVVIEPQLFKTFDQFDRLFRVWLSICHLRR